MSFSASTMGAMGLMSQIGGGITSAFGAYNQAKSDEINLSTAAKISEANARIADLGAEQELMNGKQEVAALTLRAGKIKAAQTVGLASHGVDIGEGSAAELLASTDIMKDIDKGVAEANAIRAAWGYRTQAANSRIDALSKKASASSISPMYSLGTSLLGSATNVASSWYSLNNAGVFGSSGSTLDDLSKTPMTGIATSDWGR